MDKQKQKQIEEMAKIILEASCKGSECANCEFVKRVEEAKTTCLCIKSLYNAGYRKIPENAVVLTREELFRDSTQLSKEKQIETIHNIILENLDYGYEETARAIYDANYRKIPKLGVILPFDHYDNLLKTDKQVRKETAEKFAERLKAMAYQSTDWSHGEHPMVVEVDYIDEICEEITEDKV